MNEKRLLLQHCSACDRLQYPIKANCGHCDTKDELGWKEVEGKGHILETLVVHDTRVVRLKGDVPFNVSIISLDEDPSINFLANLPGTPVNEAPQAQPWRWSSRSWSPAATSTTGRWSSSKESVGQ